MSEHDPHDFQGHEDDEARTQEKKKRDALTERDDFIWLMKSKQGRRIVHGMLDRAGVWRSSFSESLAVMSFNEGRRNEGLYLLAQIQAAGMANYEQMLKEGKEE
ncbi:Bbp19 family protein [Comamonas sp. C24C]